MADIFDFYVYDDRSIQFTLAEPIMLEDKDVTEFRFRIPKSLNGFDMSTWAWWFVYVNAKREKFSIPLTLVNDEDEPESFSTATFSINYGITEKDGGIQFALEVIDADEGGNVLHEWHTRTYNTSVTWTLQGNQTEYEEDITQDILSSIFEQIAVNRAQIALNKARIDNIASLPEGSTTADAELIDIRVGADGKIYQTAGEAVRGQVTALKKYLKETYLGSQGTVPSNIDHFLETGWYRITPSYQTATLPTNLIGETHTLIVIAPASPLTAGLQILISSTGALYTRYVFSGTTAPSTWKQYATIADVNDLRTFIDSQIEMFLSLSTSRVLTPTYTTGKYIDSSGVMQNNTDTQISDAIELKAGNTITLYARGYLDRVSMIAECDDSGNYISGKVRSIDSAFRIYTYTPLYDCYVLVSGYTQNMKVYLTEKEEYFDYIENLLDLSEVYSPTDITWSDGYISNNGVEYSDTNAACKKSSLINLKAGYTIKVNAHYSGSSVSIISKYNNGAYIPLVISDASINTYEYTATEDMQVCVSGRAKADYIARSVIIYRKTKNAPSLDFINLSMFENFGVVGDSFASGVLMTGSNIGEAHYNLSWGQVLARNLGTECVNFSEGGLTTKSWLTSAKGLPLLLSSDAQDIYYLALGINDAYHLSNEPIVQLGTISDIKADYRQNPDSFYGNYGRIIDQIKAKAQNAKLIMFTVATYSNATYSSPNKTSISNAIKEIANHYSIPVIDQDADWFFRSDFYLNNMVFSHPTAPLYSGMANAFKRMIESTIHDNYSYFADYGY